MRPTRVLPALRLAAVLLVAWVCARQRTSSPALWIETLVFVGSTYGLVASASMFVDHALALGRRVRISELGAGALIIAIGTSAPELFSSVAAAARERTDLVVGNVLGTVISNTFLGFGLPALLLRRSLFVHERVLATKMPVFGGAVVLAVATLADGAITRLEGAVMLALLAGYLRHMVRETRREHDEAQEDEEAPGVESPTVGLVVGALFGLAGLWLSGDLVVGSLLEASKVLGVSSVKLATSILAVGTSIPEIATAMTLVRLRRFDGLFGEVLGSNIFDLLGILGGISVFMTVSMDGPVLLLLAASTIVMYLITLHMMHDRRIEPIEGGILIALAFQFYVMLGAA